MNDYTNSLLDFENEFLKSLREYAKEFNVPILRIDAASLLYFLVKQSKPLHILESGTAIGYSSILMADAADGRNREGFKIDSIEIEEETAMIARDNISKVGLRDKIKVIIGDCTEVFPCITGQYDFIFVDSSKGHYIDIYEDAKRLLAPGGIFVCDNVVFYGKINDEPENAPHKHRTIVSRLRAFLEKLTNDKDFTTSIIDVGDGMSISLKN